MVIEAKVSELANEKGRFGVAASPKAFFAWVGTSSAGRPGAVWDGGEAGIPVRVEADLRDLPAAQRSARCDRWGSLSLRKAPHRSHFARSAPEEERKPGEISDSREAWRPESRRAGASERLWGVVRDLPMGETTICEKSTLRIHLCG